MIEPSASASARSISGGPDWSPASSFPTPRDRRIAPHPPGPGLPLHAPSVKISTSAIDAIRARPGDAAVKAQLFEIFERVLGTNQRAGSLVEPIVEACQ